jgi:cation:H+ antiporter
VTGIVITLAAAAWLRVNVRGRGVPVWALLVCGVLYVTYLAITLSR